VVPITSEPSASFLTLESPEATIMQRQLIMTLVHWPLMGGLPNTGGVYKFCDFQAIGGRK